MSEPRWDNQSCRCEGCQRCRRIQGNPEPGDHEDHSTAITYGLIAALIAVVILTAYAVITGHTG